MSGDTLEAPRRILKPAHTADVRIEPRVAVGDEIESGALLILEVGTDQPVVSCSRNRASASASRNGRAPTFSVYQLGRGIDPVIVVGRMTRAVAVYMLSVFRGQSRRSRRRRRTDTTLCRDGRFSFNVLTMRYATARDDPDRDDHRELASSEWQGTRGTVVFHTSRINTPLVQAKGVPYSLRSTFSQSNSVLRSVLERPRSDGNHLGTRAR